MDRGQPILLPPGLHQWTSSTMNWEKGLDLSQHVIAMGPYTMLTVDEGIFTTSVESRVMRL